MLELITDEKIPVGLAARTVFDWLQVNATGFFDSLSLIFAALIKAILWALQSPHPFIIILCLAILTWVFQKRYIPVVLVIIGFLFILNQGYWEETTESLTLVLSSRLICMPLGVPIGIAAAHRPRLYAVLRPVLDLMQTLPTFVYLFPAIVFLALAWFRAYWPRLFLFCLHLSG